MLTFGEKLEDALIAKNMTKKQLAEAVGVSGATVTNWCTGTRVPTADKIIKLCLLLDIDLYDALGINGHTNPPTPKDMDIVNKIKKLSSEKRDTVIKIIEYLSD